MPFEVGFAGSGNKVKKVYFSCLLFLGGEKSGERNVTSYHGMVSIAQHICTLLGYSGVVPLVNSFLSDTENRVFNIFILPLFHRMVLFSSGIKTESEVVVSDTYIF